MGIRNQTKEKVIKPAVTEKKTSEEVKEKTIKKEDKKATEEKSYSKKIDKVYATTKSGDCFVEAVEDGFNLLEDAKGINCKVRFNFAQLDEHQKQKVFISHYLDITSFLYLRYLFMSGVVYELEDEYRKSTKKFKDPVFSEFKAPEEGDVKTSKSLTLIPGMKSGNWMLNAAYTHDGKTERVGVPMSTQRLVSLLEMIYISYTKYLMVKELKK